MSAQSGINVDDEVVTIYNALQLKHKYSYVVFKISDDMKKVEPDCQGEPEAAFEEFVEKLPKDDCRYAAIDVKFDTEGSGHREKICFVVWCPETAPIKKKMVYASTKDTLKKKLSGLAAEYQADCLGDMKYSEVLDKVKKAK